MMDRELDEKVGRTAERPLTAGRVEVWEAWAFLAVQWLSGLLVLLALRRAAQWRGLLAVPLVAAYPFMKRIIDYPQAWLGLTFSWGVLVGYAAVHGGVTFAAIIAYLAMALWTFGYDTLYALEDREDDAFNEIGSSAVALGERWRGVVAAAFFLAGFLLWIAVLREGQAANAFATGSEFARTIQAASFAGIAFVIATMWTLWDIDEAAPQAGLLAFRRQVPIGGVVAAFLFACPLVT